MDKKRLLELAGVTPTEVEVSNPEVAAAPSDDKFAALLADVEALSKEVWHMKTATVNGPEMIIHISQSLEDLVGKYKGTPPATTSEQTPTAEPVTESPTELVRLAKTAGDAIMAEASRVQHVSGYQDEYNTTVERVENNFKALTHEQVVKHLQKRMTSGASKRLNNYIKNPPRD